MLKRLTTANLSRGYSWEILVGVFSPNLFLKLYFRQKKKNIPNPFSDLVSKIQTRFQPENFLDYNVNEKIHFKFAHYISSLFIWNWKDKNVYTLP